MKNRVIRKMIVWALVLLLIVPVNALAAPALKPTNEAQWIDRIADLPDYARDFYDWLVENSDGDGADDALIDPYSATYDSGAYVYTVAVFEEKIPFTVSAGQNAGDAGCAAAEAAINKNFSDGLPR